jgi:hypothetical protein
LRSDDLSVGADEGQRLTLRERGKSQP